MKTLSRSAITSLLITLDLESLKGDSASRMAISEAVAEQTERIIDGTEQAKVLFKAEKKLISERGNDINNYLVRDSVSVKDVLEAYYKGVIDRNNFRRLSANYSISEMMLMLGTFMHLMEARNISLEIAKTRSRQVKFGKFVQRLRGQAMSSEKNEDIKFLENLVSNSKTSEERMLEYMQEQVTVIMKSILEEMGSNFGLAPKRQLESICLAAHELCVLAPAMKGYFEERETNLPAVHTDVSLLDACGERSPKLYTVMEPFTRETTEAKKGTK